MNMKMIAKFMYWNAIPFVVGAVAFYYFNKIEDPWDFMKVWITFLVIAFPFIIIHVWIGRKIFKERLTLADKMTRCRLRMQYGSSYCVDCADSYTCASTIDNANIKL